MRNLLIFLCAFSLLALPSCKSMGHGEKDHEEREEGDEVKMSLDQVPPAARQSLQAQAGGATITSVDKEMKNGKTIYETDVMIGGKNMEIKVAEDGTVISKKEDKEEDEKKGKEDDEKEEGNEVKVKIDQVPAAARATIEKETAGGKIEDIAKVMSGGKTFYETDVKMADGKEYEIQVGEDGKVLSKKQEHDDEKGKEDKEDDEKNEKEGK